MTRSTLVDPLEERLSSPPHLEGAAFTAAVLRRLPARRTGARTWVLGAAAALATGISAALLARASGALGPALLAAIQGSLPGGSGVVALLTLAAAGLTAAVAVMGELGDDREPDPI